MLTIHISNWWNTSNYVTDWRKGKTKNLQETLSIKSWLWSTFLAATSTFCSHFYGGVVWPCLSRHKWFTLQKLCFLLQGQVRFVASSVCEGAQYVTEITVNTNSQGSPRAFPKLTFLESACSHWHQTGGKLPASSKYSQECMTPLFCPVAPTLKLKLMHLHTNL